MNRQQENNCIAYFKSNSVWDRVFRGFWEKYRSYGSFSGKVVLQKITAEEVEGLEGFFAKSFHGKKSVTVSAERFSQALLSSRFSNMTPAHLLELYFREKLVGKKEERQLEEQKKDRFLQHWKEKYQGTPVEKVLSELLDVIKAGHIKNLNEWEQSLMLGAEIYNCFPFRKNETKYLAVFATEITGSPHAFDQKGSWGTFLYQVIQMELRQRKVFPQKSEIFPAFFRQRCFLAEGILIDDISNYVMLSHVKAQKKDGDLHMGMEGFWQEDDMVQIPLAVLVNESSASASEIFAGAIKDYDYGTLIGTKTFGKGIVQTVFPLENGDAIKITTAKYYTPKGHYIHGKGIQPDIKLEYKYSGPEDESYDMKYDNQLQKAISVVKEKIN